MTVAESRQPTRRTAECRMHQATRAHAGVALALCFALASLAMLVEARECGASQTVLAIDQAVNCTRVLGECRVTAELNSDARFRSELEMVITMNPVLKLLQNRLTAHQRNHCCRPDGSFHA